MPRNRTFSIESSDSTNGSTLVAPTTLSCVDLEPVKLAKNVVLSVPRCAGFPQDGVTRDAVPLCHTVTDWAKD
jgi:hypothetical protein